MQFGKVESVEGISFHLPSDHEDTSVLFSNVEWSDEPLKAWIGGTMWTIPAWIGSCYPLGTKSKQFTEAYGKQFGTIELNATHYRTPTMETIRKWSEAMPEDFLFSPKFPQGISHYRKFVQCEALTDQFLEAVYAFGKQLGPCFIQLPPHFGPDKAEILANYLNSLPEDLALAIEFRHEAWFRSGNEVDALWELLRARNISAVITDTPGRRDAVHMRLTSPQLIVRFGGYFPHPSDEMRIMQWMERISEWKAKGLREVHIWIHQPESAFTPQSSIQWAEAFETRLGIKVKAPKIQNHLF